MKFPYWQPYMLSWMLMRNLSLNSNTQGNCSVSCHTHSMNCVKTGDTSFGSPSKCPHLQTSQHVEPIQLQETPIRSEHQTMSNMTNPVSQRA
ncbi:hypothetical protein AALO_G00026990 [Alosa alosa]|uniref:Uncharacterized protein n=1 Tax=Alosa alosa TaxID=278164 RepID=A0AAV6HB00_9TELE|nr:hypothetical protein AALO_G00026990 [Alosa alosa]